MNNIINITTILSEIGLTENIINIIKGELKILKTESEEDINKEIIEIENENSWSSLYFNNIVKSFGTGRFPISFNEWRGLSYYTKRQLFNHFDKPYQILALLLINSRNFLENNLITFGIRNRQRKLILNQLEEWKNAHDLCN